VKLIFPRLRIDNAYCVIAVFRFMFHTFDRRNYLMTVWKIRMYLGAMLVAVCAMAAAPQLAYGQDPPADPPAEEEEEPDLGALDTPPLQPDLSDFIADKDKAIVLGKALFWDMQVGSDGKTACASCHFHAGVDNRLRNTVAPNGAGIDSSGGGGGAQFRGANTELQASDFPFHRLEDRTDRDSDVEFDTSEIVGSQGVVTREFRRIIEGRAPESGRLVADPIFSLGGCNARQVTGRNTPTVISAVFNDRQFWDGRANRFFNGVNPFGDTDPDAKVWCADDNGDNPRQVRILLDKSSLASQAVGPPLSDVEMSWKGRTFPDIGRKVLVLRPLAQQRVHPRDSVLGPYADNNRGLANTNYAKLVREAFKSKWWANDCVDGEFTQMEANFSLFWGLAIQCYEATLIPNESPFDKFSRGDESALTEQQKQGLEIFKNEGKCANCHGGPEFTGAAASQVRDDPIEHMLMQRGPLAFYDNGFYNIGVRPTEEDLGVGASGPFGPFSFTLRKQGGDDNIENAIDVPAGDRTAVRGAFKTPTLRNIELTGPYMHNGGMKSLREVVEFYTRGADFFDNNIDDLDPDVDGIDELGKDQGEFDEEKVEALVAFMKSLTDRRVQIQAAPFDHPDITIVNGHKPFSVNDGVLKDNNVYIPRTGRKGRGDIPLKPFEEILP